MTAPPVLGNLWSHPALCTDNTTGAGLEGMHPNIDLNLNTLAADIGALPGNLADFRAAMRTASAAVTASAVIALDTVIADSASGWNATTHQYTIPSPGIWLIEAQFSQNAANTLTVAVRGLPTSLYGVGLITACSPANVNPSSAYLPLTPILFFGGEVVDFFSLTTTTALGQLAGGQDTSWLNLTQIGRAG